MSRFEDHGWSVRRIPVHRTGVGEDVTVMAGADLAFAGNWLPA